ELDSSRPSAARNERGDRDHQLVPLPWQKIHVLLLSDRVIKPTTSWVAQTTRIGARGRTASKPPATTPSSRKRRSRRSVRSAGHSLRWRRSDISVRAPVH